MALKDAIDKIVSYFDTDEVTDYEDAAKEEAKERPVKAQKPVQTQPPRQQRQPERSQATVPPRRQHVHSDLQETQVLRSLPLSRSQANQGPQQMNTTKTTIAIKYPKKYEDAQEIVELLIENECVLIDFQYMLEAQARRCLDFIDGAEVGKSATSLSKVSGIPKSTGVETTSFVSSTSGLEKSSTCLLLSATRR